MRKRICLRSLGRCPARLGHTRNVVPPALKAGSSTFTDCAGPEGRHRKASATDHRLGGRHSALSARGSGLESAVILPASEANAYKAHGPRGEKSSHLDIPDHLFRLHLPTMTSELDGALLLSPARPRAPLQEVVQTLDGAMEVLPTPLQSQATLLLQALSSWMAAGEVPCGASDISYFLPTSPIEEMDSVGSWEASVRGLAWAVCASRLNFLSRFPFHSLLPTTYPHPLACYFLGPFSDPPSQGPFSPALSYSHLSTSPTPRPPFCAFLPPPVEPVH